MTLRGSEIVRWNQSRGYGVGALSRPSRSPAAATTPESTESRRRISIAPGVSALVDLNACDPRLVERLGQVLANDAVAAMVGSFDFGVGEPLVGMLLKPSADVSPGRGVGVHLDISQLEWAHEVEASPNGWCLRAGVGRSRRLSSMPAADSYVADVQVRRTAARNQRVLTAHVDGYSAGGVGRSSTLSWPSIMGRSPTTGHHRARSSPRIPVPLQEARLQMPDYWSTNRRAGPTEFDGTCQRRRERHASGLSHAYTWRPPSESTPVNHQQGPLAYAATFLTD